MTNSEVIEMLEAEWRDRLKAAVLAEREACAKVCDEANIRFHALWEKFEYPEDQAMSIGASQCSAAIRERNSK